MRSRSDSLFLSFLKIGGDTRALLLGITSRKGGISGSSKVSFANFCGVLDFLRALFGVGAASSGVGGGVRGVFGGSTLLGWFLF